MVSLVVLFWMYVVLFAIIGAMRGWAKELLVTASTILALFIINLLEAYADPLKSLDVTTQFYIRAAVVVLLVFFGYQTPSFRALAGARFARERFQDILLGLILGGVNGYMVVGTIWYFMAEAGYPFTPYFTAPDQNSELGRAAIEMISKLPPVFMDPPFIYFAVGLAFLFVIVVFI